MQRGDFFLDFFFARPGLKRGPPQITGSGWKSQTMIAELQQEELRSTSGEACFSDSSGNSQAGDIGKRTPAAPIRADFAEYRTASALESIA